MQGDTRGAQLLRRAMRLLAEIDHVGTGCYAAHLGGCQPSCKVPAADKLIAEIAEHVAEAERQQQVLAL